MTDYKEEWEKWNTIVLKSISFKKRKDAIEEVDGIEKILGLKDYQKNIRILDAPCGYGRHSIEFAKRGYKNIIGVDFSFNVIEKARKQNKKENVGVKFLYKDIFELDYSNYFDVILNLYTSFGLNTNDKVNLALLKKYNKMLKPDGLFFLEFVNPKTHFFDKEIIEENYPSENKKAICREKRTLKDRIVIYEHTLINENLPILKSTIPLRLYSLQELKSLLEKANFRVKDIFGNYKKNYYSTVYSPNLITVSKKTIKEEAQ